MNLELFIARRIARNRPGNRPGVMERIAVVAVAVSVSVMVLSLAVIMGFKRQITDRVTGFTAQVEVSPHRPPMQRDARLEETIHGAGRVASIAPFAVKNGVMKGSDAIVGVVLKGVDGNYDLSFIGRYLEEGALPRVGDSIRTKEILISRSVARQMQLGVDDRVEMLFMENDRSPRRDRFKVSGIYSTGMEEFDGAVAMTDLRNVQRLSAWESGEISGYELILAQDEDEGAYADRLNELFAEDEAFWHLTAASSETRYPLIFDWLKTHDVNAAVILIIMTIVAVFNMATALLTLVLERTHMIGVLKTMGMTARSLRRIFLYRAGIIIARGIVWGNVVGLGLCLSQHFFHWAKLDPEGYMLSEVPVSLGVGWWLALNAAVAAVILAMLMWPASVVSRIKPEESIRYNA